MTHNYVFENSEEVSTLYVEDGIFECSVWSNSPKPSDIQFLLIKQREAVVCL